MLGRKHLPGEVLTIETEQMKDTKNVRHSDFYS